MIRILLILAGGGLGALCRYGLGVAGGRVMGAGFPWGTLAANMLGCLLIGIAFGLTGRAQWFTPEIRLFFMTGFLGALTTFSTYALESVNYLRNGSHVALTNFLVNNIGGGLLVLAGLWLVQVLAEGR
ncbi:MAG: fluoride efflux transporter CrcB [Deltaproteobacteria bacterium]|nr:fluoride efflux transporter CrcB [Deltaproteobacteria bacterium]